MGGGSRERKEERESGGRRERGGVSRGEAYIIWSAQEVCFLCSPLGECLWQEEGQQQEEKEGKMRREV